ncbi:hypothetical protein AKJ09_09093 [Labilithrix luteola]|uniref:Tetratricopeptide repeat protein n=1 Tax=Labilithrix luteola TaxID=1391654 RepID=A0A0K1QAI2_9BACT|nr:hypothetical protein [Labilithrix luteola]AKV02430.1 hypothetical protein AKJ09_09093 [Labilithrix luteola]
MKPEWLDAFELDSDAGPAAPLRSSETKALARQAVDRALAPAAAAATQAHHSWWRFAGFGAGGALTVVGVFFVVHTTDARCVEARCVDRPVVSVRAETAAAPSIAPPADHPTIEAQPIESVSVTALPNAPAAPAPSAVRVPTHVGERVDRPAATASDLLAEANRARRESEWERAAALYERVMRSQADESYAATVALASLRLEHFGNPQGALALYERALADRPSGSLSSQAEAGAARCRRALGKGEPTAP